MSRSNLTGEPLTTTVNLDEERSRLRNIKPLQDKVRSDIKNPDVWTKPGRYTGADSVIDGDPGYEKHIKIKLTGGGVRIESTRPYPPSLSEEYLSELGEALIEYYVDGE